MPLGLYRWLRSLHRPACQQPILPATPLYTPAAPAPPANAEHALVMKHWQALFDEGVQLAWPDFIAHLEALHRYSAEQRAEREAKLKANHSTAPVL